MPVPVSRSLPGRFQGRSFFLGGGSLSEAIKRLSGAEVEFVVNGCRGGHDGLFEVYLMNYFEFGCSCFDDGYHTALGSEQDVVSCRNGREVIIAKGSDSFFLINVFSCCCIHTSHHAPVFDEVDVPQIGERCGNVRQTAGLFPGQCW